MIFQALICPLRFRSSSLARQRAARVEALTIWMPKKSNRVSLLALRAAIRPAIMLFLIAEATLHGSRAQGANYTVCSADISVFILWLGTFAGETGGYAMFGAILSVLVVWHTQVRPCQFHGTSCAVRVHPKDDIYPTAVHKATRSIPKAA